MGSRGDAGSNDRDVSGAEAVASGGKLKTYSDKKRKDFKPADYNPEKDDTEAKMDLFYEQGATNIKNMKFQTPTTAILSVLKRYFF